MDFEFVLHICWYLAAPVIADLNYILLYIFPGTSWTLSTRVQT